MEGKHYFTDNRDLPSHRRDLACTFQGKDYTFTVDNGVFSKREIDEGTIVLLKAIAKEDPLSGRMLDLGCGYGVIGIILKGMYPDLEVTAADVNPRAVELTVLNSTRNAVKVSALVSDGFAGLASSKFDSIVTNPPIRAGKKTIYRLFEEAYAHLEDNGVFYAVIRRDQGAESAMNKLAEVFGSCDLIDRKRGYWVLRCVKAEN